MKANTVLKELFRLMSTRSHCGVYLNSDGGYLDDVILRKNTFREFRHTIIKAVEANLDCSKTKIKSATSADYGYVVNFTASYVIDGKSFMGSFELRYVTIY